MTQDKRAQVVRRQFNESFCTNGIFSWNKFCAAWGQVAALYHFGRSFDDLVDAPETMLILLAFIILPSTISKIITLKYGGGK